MAGAMILSRYHKCVEGGHLDKGICHKGKALAEVVADSLCHQAGSTLHDSESAVVDCSLSLNCTLIAHACQGVLECRQKLCTVGRRGITRSRRMALEHSSC